MRATRNRHDCANDGTCGRSIRNCEVGSTEISFFDNNRSLIAKVPKLPKYSSDKYGNRLYKEAESMQFSRLPKIDEVLPNSFTVKYGYLTCTIKYDNLSKQEQSQTETDIRTAYEAFKEKFCLESSDASYDITTYIFNNRNDYTRYNDLLSINADGGPTYIVRGVTDYRNILTYKQDSMDFVLGHELGHIFQMRFSPAKEVQDLHSKDTEFIANVVGREVEEKNNRTICEQKGVDEYRDYGWLLKFKYKGTLFKIYSENLSQEEKSLIIQDVKSSYRSLVSECDGLRDKGTILSIYLQENNDIKMIQFQNPYKNTRKFLDNTLISRSKPEQSENEISQINQEPTVEPGLGKEPEEEPSHSLFNVMYSAVEYIIGSISSFFSWLFGSKKEEQPEVSLLKLDVDQSNHDIDENCVDSYLPCNHDYHQHDDLI